MKRFLGILLICLMLAVNFEVSASADGPEMYVVNCSEWVSLRASPSTKAARIVKIPLGAMVENCESVSAMFTHCTYNGASGYVLSEYLSVNAPSAGDGEDYVGEMRVVNCSEWVSLRSRPSTSSARLAKVPLGAVLMDCTRYSSGFVYGNYNGQWGYVLSEYLSRVPDQVAAGEGFVGDMIVVNCDEWVSLREAPSTSAARLSTVPLGAVVSNCTWYSGNFICCEYNGMSGYILSSYLQETGTAEGFYAAAPISGLQASSDRGRLILEHVVGEYTAFAYYDYAADGENLYVECLDAQGGRVWDYFSHVPFSTELQSADAFIGGTAERPMVMAYNASEGLYALDFYTGQVQWMLSKETASLGGSISAAVDENGTMYIGGYYGPDPVAIDMTGNVLWSAETSHDAYWLYEIEVTAEGVVATYDCIDEHEAAGQITYGFDGTVLNVIWF